MKRIFTYTIPSDFDGQTLQAFLKAQCYSSQIITHLKRTENGILLNGIWGRVRDILHTDDTLTITLIETESSENIVPSNLPLDIVYEDEDLLIINKAADSADGEILKSEGDVQTELFLLLTEFQSALENAAADFAPSAVAEYAYKLAQALNKYYHEYKVLAEEDESKRKSRLSTLKLALDMLVKMMDILAIEIPERM